MLEKPLEWHDNRRSGVGGSDAGAIMRGEWYALWLIKTGRAEPEDLSDNLSVQIGSYTEELNLIWFERHTGHRITGRRLEVRHPYFQFMRCELDGAADVDGKPAIVQAKWCNPWAQIKELEQKYAPQVTHEMVVYGCNLGFLSVITGKPSYELVRINHDEDYIAELLRREQTFWSYVESDTPPPDAPPVEPPAPVAVYRTIDMSQSNSWSEQAGIWRETLDASRRCDKAAMELRALIEPDVGEARGHGVVVKRSKDGKLMLREDDDA